MSSYPIIFWELASNDAENSVAFFKKAFGWKIEFDKETGIHYVPIPKDENKFAGGGIFTLTKAKLPFLTLYIEVDDIDRRANELERLGAYIVEPPHDITPRSRICLFNEPSGVTFALLQRKK